MLFASKTKIYILTCAHALLFHKQSLSSFFFGILYQTTKTRIHFPHMKKEETHYKKAIRTDDLYRHIGCKRGASFNKVKDGIKHTLLKIHPDKHASAGEAEKKKLHQLMCCVNETKEILGDRLRRHVYNLLLRKGVLPPHGGLNTDFATINKAIDDVISTAK